MRIDLEDNNRFNNAKRCNRKEVAAIFPIAGKSIVELCKANENLLIFPHCLSETEDKIEKETIIDIKNTEDSEIVQLCTGNIMGFLGVGDLQIKIKSRFDSKGRDNLLHYMLQKVLSFNLFDLNHNQDYEDVFDFILFMFPYFLKSAMSQGVYREYQNYKHNNSNVKGAIDVARHLKKNIPFVGNIAYSTREYSHDNNVTELIRHTIEFIKTRKYGDAVLNIDKETRENVATIVEYTPLYDRKERSKIINKNLRMKVHPYYTEYSPLRVLCLQILRMEEIKYGESDDEICGILFDGAWLWEEYVNTILKKYGFVHLENKKGKHGIKIFEDGGWCYPDFYKEDFVLDAKYKRLKDLKKVSGVANDDLYQMISYMTILSASKGGFVSPLTEKQVSIPCSIINGTNGSTISIFGIEISKKESFVDFCLEMEQNEEAFIKSLGLN
jgi:5-methylcytosine-specific restriction endonuclease McrBC regulatory subunit McrC